MALEANKDFKVRDDSNCQEPLWEEVPQGTRLEFRYCLLDNNKELSTGRLMLNHLRFKLD